MVQNSADPRLVSDAGLPQHFGALLRVACNGLALLGSQRMAIALQLILEPEHADIHGKRGRHDSGKFRLLNIQDGADNVAGDRRVHRMPD